MFSPLFAEWENEKKVDRYEILRLIYQGRFLHGNVTLGALRLQQGQSSRMSSKRVRRTSLSL